MGLHMRKGAYMAADAQIARQYRLLAAAVIAIAHRDAAGGAKYVSGRIKRSARRFIGSEWYKELLQLTIRGRIVMEI